MDISILIPGIRTDLWPAVYDSITKSCTRYEWEVIFVGPNLVPASLRAKGNVHFAISYAAPLTCRQNAFLFSTGKYVCWAADDVLFAEGSLDEAYDTISKETDYKKMIIGKYAEGSGTQMLHDPYWYLDHHGFLKGVMARYPKDFFLINTGLVSRQIMMEIGGFDCQFECCAMGCCDISLRLQIYGGRGILQQNPFFYSSHLPAYAGDHGPIHDAQTLHDMPLFTELWLDKDNGYRIQIDANNFLQYSEVWGRRFGPVRYA